MKKGILIGIGLFLLVIGFLFDKIIVNYIVGNRISSLNPIISFISLLGSALFVFIISTLLFALDKDGRKYVPALWITLLLALGITFVLKYLVARPRPLVNALQVETDYSFPSGHATAVFAPLILIDKLYPKLKWLWLSLGILVLFSRIYLGVHYLSDVAAGALIGYITGIIVLRVAKVNF